MKKLLFIVLAAVALTALQPHYAHAQGSGSKDTLKSVSNASGLDTVTNTGVVVQSQTLVGYWDVVTIQVDVTKISGTVGGSIVLSGSVTGGSYVAIGSPITPSDGTKSYTFAVNPSTWAFYKVTYTGASTMAASVRSYALWRYHEQRQIQY